MLTFYGNICRLDDDAPLRRLALRQLTKSVKSHSWYAYARDIAAIYNINLVGACEQPWPKEAWKRHIKDAVYRYRYAKMMSDAIDKTSLHWLDYTLLQRGEPHIIWQSCMHNLGQVHKAIIRVKLLTGTYMLQERQAKFSKKKVSPLCNNMIYNLHRQRDIIINSNLLQMEVVPKGMDLS